jgi:transposase
VKTREKQLEILFCSPKGLSYRETGRRVGCDRRTAKKYIEHPELIGQRRKSPPRPSLVDPYRDQIEAYLGDEYGNHRASWIYDQLVKSGYTAGYEIVKRAVRQMKGRRQHLAYVRFETVPGEQAQVDFGEFQVTLPDGSIKKYYLFAMILGYSRRLFACLLERCDLPSFLDAHILAFEHFGGVPHEILYDRMKNVYIRKLCDTLDPAQPGHGAGRPLFTQGLMTLAVHYGFIPLVAPAYAAWVKGKIERPMDFLRESWWRGYDFSGLAAANHDLAQWLTLKESRVHGTTRERVDVRFEREKPHLHHLPPVRCDVSLRLTRQVRKDCTISVDGNRYIVPHTLVGRDLTIRLKDEHLRIFNGAELVEEYDAPEGKGHLMGLDRGHYDALRADQQMQARKFAASRAGAPCQRLGQSRHKHKGRARFRDGGRPSHPRGAFRRTISPTVPRHLVVVEPIIATVPVVAGLSVERRSIELYGRIGGSVTPGGYPQGEVCHG